MLKDYFVKSVQIIYVLLQTLTRQWTGMSTQPASGYPSSIQTQFGSRFPETQAAAK